VSTSTAVAARRHGWRAALIATTTAFITAIGTAALAAPGIDPAVVTQNADPGTSITITKTVHTPEIPPKPDVVLLVDTTGSMGGAIANVQANMNTIISTVSAAQPTAQFAVASYKDVSDGAGLFNVNQQLTDNTTDLQNAVNSLSAGGGGDTPEAWINALYQVSTGAITFRADSSRIVVLIGDASSHDPSNGHTLTDAINALQAISAKVLGVNVASGGADGLDAAGQATAVTSATGGSLTGADPADVSTAILAGLANLDVTVEPHLISCDTGLSVTFDHGAVTVPSGSDVVYQETINIAADAPQGSTLHCVTEFLINGTSPTGDLFVQHVNITVNDKTAPVGACDKGVNPAGNQTGTKPNAGYADGFYQLNATDNLDPNPMIYIRDTGDSSVNFGPYPSGTTIKLTQAPGAAPSVSPGTGAVDYKVKLRGDAQLVATDAAGNVSATALCLVPPAPR